MLDHLLAPTEQQRNRFALCLMIPAKAVIAQPVFGALPYPSANRGVPRCIQIPPPFKTDFFKVTATMTDLPNPPKHLEPSTRQWFRDVSEKFELEQHHYRLLTLAGEAWDRCQAAREAIAKHGIVFVDRFGAPRARPEVAIERDCRLAFARLVRELDLDIAPPTEPRRAPPLASNRRG